MSWTMRLKVALALLLPMLLADAHAASRNYTLYISAGNLTVNGAGGATLKVWGYSDTSGSPMVPGPMLTVDEGDTVSITVVNNHNISHNFVIQGVTTDTTPIPPGQTRGYSFAASSAGTYLYTDTLNSNVNREMGMYGVLRVGPAGGGNTVWTGGPAFDLERTWVMAEMDKPRWNDVAGSGGTVDTSVYKPNYFMINGMGGFDAMEDHNTQINGLVGQVALVRMVNPGQFAHSQHFHGNHVKVVAVNGVRQSEPYKQLDVLNVPPMTTLDVLLPLSQAGIYPMHIHSAQMETANGVYLNGSATLWVAQ